VSVAATVLVPAPPADAWARWTDLSAWPRWNPYCVSACVEGPLAAGTRLELQLRHPRGRDFWTRPTLTAVRPGEELSWEARAPGLRAATQTTLAAEGDGTRMTVRSSRRGPLSFTLRMTLSDKVMGRIYVETLDALRRSFAGEPAVPA
jgi:uncharacterized protein YndB with AHSA1/START domain